MAKIVSSKLPLDEAEYSTRHLLHSDFRIPQFYGSPKVHKNILPVPLRPVVSQCGSLLAVASTYIDYKLQPLTAKIPSYIKNSKHVIQQLQQLGTLPPSARIFTSDAESMYTNIDPIEGVQTLSAYLTLFSNEIKHNINANIVIQLTNLVMRNGIFKFGDTWWFQQIGTAMGTPVSYTHLTLPTSDLV